MKKKTILSCILAFLSFISIANAALYDRGGGLIYDDVLDVTWLQDANYMATDINDSNGSYWNQALEWVENLEYYDSVRDVTWTDWRLPQTLPQDGTSYNYTDSPAGDSDKGFNISAPGTLYEGSTMSEMAHLYYVTLGNLGRLNVNGNYQDMGEKNWGPFINIKTTMAYWSGNVYETDPDDYPLAFSFAFQSGKQSGGRQYLDSFYAWAVRDGDVAAVPIPTAIWLLGSGLLGLIGLRRNLKS